MARFTSHTTGSKNDLLTSPFPDLSGAIENAVFDSYNMSAMSGAKDMYLVKIDQTIFPLGPSHFSFKINNADEVVTLLNEGEIVIPKREKLKSAEMELVLPGRPYPFAYYPYTKYGGRDYTAGKFRSPRHYINVLQDLKADQNPFQLYVARAWGGQNLKRNFSWKVLLSDVTFSEDPDSGADVKVSLSFTRWRDYGTKKVTFKKTDKGTKKKTDKKRPASSQKSKTSYIVKKSDSLKSIAKKKLGKVSRWKEIYKLNKKVIQKVAKKKGKPGNGNWIFPGTKLKLPKK